MKKSKRPPSEPRTTPGRLAAGVGEVSQKRTIPPWTSASCSRLAVGESKLEAVLYGLILWGVLFIGMVWLLASGSHATISSHLGR